MLDSGERQVAPTLSGVRRDHVERYRWADTQLARNSKVLDFGCGIGYGAKILADAGHRVFAVDRSEEALAFAREYYNHPNITYIQHEGGSIDPGTNFDAVVCFEVLEHLEQPQPVVAEFSVIAPLLLASVPNENVFHYTGQKFHFRHYTPDEFDGLLAMGGFGVTSWWGQSGRESAVEPNTEGRTIVVRAEAGAESISHNLRRSLHHVAILGLGPSLEIYVDRVKRMGSRKAFADEVWGINAVGDVIACDRIFHMDDVRIQEIRAAAAPQSNIAHMLTWLRRHHGPIYTSRAYEDYPGLVEFPLEEVINNLRFSYFNGTAAYAVAYALHLGVKELSIFGCDYTYEGAHVAEKGRANLEFWLGVAVERGVEINIPEKSSLLDACEPDDRAFYGYGRCGTRDVVLDRENGVAKITFKEREALLTAAEIEAEYNHSAHPNPLMRAK